jgi:organic hydroperoxide reductase OsmC/OhrA
MAEKPFEVTLERAENYRFVADFHQPGVPRLVVDEPPPLGAGDGPNPARLLAAAIGQCLSSSALFCLSKARVPVHGMHTTVTGHMERNEQGRLRIGGLTVELQPVISAEDHDRFTRCLSLFEDFCIVTESVRGGIDVRVTVEPKVVEAEIMKAV